MPETVEKKEEKQGPSSPASAPRKGRAAKVMTALALLGGLAWGASALFLFTSLSWMGSEVAKLGAAQVPIRPIALAIGCGVAALALWLGLRKAGSRYEWVKPGQARWVRGSALVMVGAMTAFGCVALYKLPSLGSLWWADLWRAVLAGKEISVKPILFPSLAVFAAVMTVAYLLLNREKWAEFLIETEGELRKVSWPARKGYLGSATVVVLVVVIVSLFLHFVDMGLSRLMHWWGIGF
jgi:preprotein translocase SecE subunit